jgi:hypothetical protein
MVLVFLMEGKKDLLRWSDKEGTDVMFAAE